MDIVRICGKEVEKKLEIDIPEHQYNNIMAIDSMSLGRAQYKGIIMYAINAIKRGKVLEQEPTTKNLAADREDAVERLNAIKQLIGYDKDSEIVKATQKSLDMAIKALEQEPILDKIRAEIKKLQKMCDKNNLNLMAQYSAFGMVLDILDKYKGYREVEE